MESSNDNKNKPDLENFLDLVKTDHNYFLFYLNTSDKTGPYSFMNEFLCLPKIPLLGKYNKNTYEMCDVISLIITDVNDNFLSLPSEIITFIKLSINEKIENNTKAPSHNFIPLVDSKSIEPRIKFYWACIENNLIMNDSQLYNIVPHTFLFDEFDFSKTRRIFMNYPICIFLTDQMKSSNIQSLKDFNDENQRNPYLNQALILIN
jgi:hypothetical protein